MGALTVGIRSDQIEVIDPDAGVLAVITGNDVSDSTVGISIDPVTRNVSLGGKLPEGLIYGTVHEGIEVVPNELLLPNSVPPVLQGFRFKNCSIVGPMILVPMGPLEISGCDFNMEGAQLPSLVWALPETGEVYGAAVAHRVSFIECSFRQIAFGVPAQEVDSFLRTLSGGGV